MWQRQYDMEIKDAIRTLAKEFYKNPSGFTSRSDFKERFYEICLGKRPFKKRYKLFPLTGKKLSILKKDFPIYFAEKEDNEILEWSYDIAILSPNLITRFNFKNLWHRSLLKNDVVGVIAAIEFLFITEDSNRVRREVESSYAKLDLLHRSMSWQHIVAFSNSHEGNDCYFERTINDPGSPLEPDIICISVQHDENGRKSVEYRQHPLPWITTSKFKDRMERLDYYMWKNFGSKWYHWKQNRLEKRYMAQTIEALKKHRIVAITGHATVDTFTFTGNIQAYLLDEDGMFGQRVTWLNFKCYEDDFGRCLETIDDAFRIRDMRGLSLEERDRLRESNPDMRRLSLQEKERLVRESIPSEKGLIIFHNVSNDALIRKALGYMGHWHAVVVSRKPIAEDVIDVSIDVGGRQKKPGFIARHLSKYLFGENRE